MTKQSLEAQGPVRLLDRILGTRDLARVVQSLDPTVLHRLVRKCGLEDSGPIIALATAEQLTRVFDADLWRGENAGREEQFDADRFGLWLEVLAEMGPDVAAGKIVELDFDFVTAALSRHVLVLEDPRQSAGLKLALGMDWDEPESGLGVEVGGFTVVARRDASVDAVLTLLTTLEAEHHAFFGRLMTRCCALSTEYIEDNGGLYEVLT